MVVGKIYMMTVLHAEELETS